MSSESSPTLSPSEPVLNKKSAVDPRFLQTEGVEAYTGNELLMKGALEAGAALITGYPGSPVSELFDCITEIAPYLAERGIVAQIANNEALATARLNGARLVGLRAMAVMKSVGFHVGADGLATGNLVEARRPDGGAVVVVGDDPWNETTQINSDSRFLSRHLNIPVLEPATFQEVKDWVSTAFELSGASDLFITYLLTTNQADGGGTVSCRPHRQLPINRNNPATLSSEDIHISDTVMIPPHTSMREATLKERMDRLIRKKRELELSRWSGPRRVKMPVGFVTAGLSSCYLEEVLRVLGLWDRTPVLKLGMTYPLDPEDIFEISSHVEHLVIVEEKRGFIEAQVSEIFTMLRQEGRLNKIPSLWGKKFPDGENGFPQTRGLNPSIILEVLGPAFLKWKKYFPTLQTATVENELEEIRHTQSMDFEVPIRTPTFCPGCPHRDSAVVNLQMKSKLLKGAQPMDVIFHGESGCHSMLQFAPNEGLMQDYSGMGLGGGTGAGMSPFIKNKQVVFLGDSTFFHSGMIAISDSLKNNQDITYVILENDTTAMTGHQPTPGNAIDIMGRATFAQDIERLLLGMIPDGLTLVRINPADRKAYEILMEETVLKPGVKVIIADKECAITRFRRINQERKAVIKDKGFLPLEEKINITPEVCEYCLECTRQTGCPGLTVEETPYGRKIATDLTTCVDDAACARTSVCPSFEKVTIERSERPGKTPLSDLSLTELSEPKKLEFTGRWSAYTAAVGGMGAGVVNAVLVRAGMKEGYDVSFLDKKGLAIRNGGVYGHVVLSSRGPVSSPVIPYGKADLLIGLDILEAARAVDGRLNLRVAHPSRTHSIINSHKNETVMSLIGRQDFDPRKLEEAILSKTYPEGYLSADFSRISEENINSKLYSNMMILGAAYQKGWIPLLEENILKAIAETVRKADIDANNQAFRLGRALATRPDFLSAAVKGETLKELIQDRISYLKRESFVFGWKRAKDYVELVEQAERWMDLPQEDLKLVARILYDLIRYENVGLAQRYLSLVWSTFRKDQASYDFKATRAVIFNLFKCMAIKDEVWVAKLLTSPEKYERDRRRYKIDSSRGDRISYRHFNRPQFTVFGWKIEFDIQTRDWMLKIMSEAKILRKLLPGWHLKERAFRGWYEQVVEGFTFFENPEDYEAYLKVLQLPGDVRGYREIRYPLMEAAVKKAVNLLEPLVAKKALSPAAVKIASFQMVK